MGRKAAKAKKKQVTESSSSDDDSSASSSRSSSSNRSEPEQQQQVKKQQKPSGKKQGGGGGGGGKAQQQQDQQQQQQKKEEEGEQQKKKNVPVEVIYCPISTWPAEMCEYSGNFAKCKQWHVDNAEMLAEAGVDQDEQGKEKGRKQKNPADASATSVSSKIKKEVSIDVRKRTGRKKLTMVRGLDLFGHQPNAIAQVWKKKFSCSVSVSDPSAHPGQPVDIEMQGDNSRALVTLLTGNEFKIPKEAIVLLRQGKPAGAAGSKKEGEESSEEEEDD